MCIDKILFGILSFENYLAQPPQRETRKFLPETRGDCQTHRQAVITIEFSAYSTRHLRLRHERRRTRKIRGRRNKLNDHDCQQEHSSNLAHDMILPMEVFNSRIKMKNQEMSPSYVPLLFAVYCFPRQRSAGRTKRADFCFSNTSVSPFQIVGRRFASTFTLPTAGSRMKISPPSVILSTTTK